ncbi:MAG: hypothetical protein KJI71_03775 [Patescibacteria group bacterium]|nr:hypothetical protein [Patescibacteria group bacterium]
MSTLTIAILLSSFLGAVHFWNEKILLIFKQKETKAKSVSFIAGASVAYIFLYLLPDLYRGVAHLNQWIFIFILLGFSLVHLLEKYFYQHTIGQERFLRFKEIHFSIFFLYYFVVGVVLTEFLRLNLLKGLLFFVPILFYAAVSRLSFKEIHIHLREQKFFKIILSLATLLGVILASAILQQSLLYHALLAFILGAFLYIVIMDFIPKEAQGRPDYFLLGLSIYTLLIILTWNF